MVAVQEPAGPVAVIGSSFPLEIRIGPERHGYVYMQNFPSGVYRCERGSDWANFGDRLFLYRTTSGPRP